MGESGFIDQVVRGGEGWAEVCNPGPFKEGQKVWLHNEHMHSRWGSPVHPAIVTVTSVELRYPTRWERFLDKLTNKTHGGLGVIRFEPKLPVSRGEYLLVEE